MHASTFHRRARRAGVAHRPRPGTDAGGQQQRDHPRAGPQPELHLGRHQPHQRHEGGGRGGDEAASFVASAGEIRGARLEAALLALRSEFADAREASDQTLAEAILAL
jgi:hypothetical protein